ncbi:MAG TPA: M20/M25/M40 family metallo-hydrolase [Candidatus Krumholzibacteria bacterium]|nr:M20/M25/M40 family metallo-hydrolase [Candidatus Krumholzibacteria bacterium]HPD72445.1 M20/M25/M40 family metallo-hydrolase [Candidatus Krumholzibacteria bacterium]HRY40623.1 M20/M25/M40 family metallo-hydrolase [Candidatus Krumholzibacteria bacterium]
MRHGVGLALAVLGSIGALGACQRGSSDEVSRGVAAIEAEAMLADVATLAGPHFSGRLAGDAGFEAAARWAARRFDRLGLEPGGDDGYLQHLPIETNIIRGTPALRVVTADGAVVDAVLGRDFTCRGFTGSGAADTTVVFAGYGLSAPERGYDDYAGLDVAGKIVLVFKQNPGWSPDTTGWAWPSGTPRVKGGTARAHGAVAMLWFQVPGEDDLPGRGPIGSVLHGDGDHLSDLPQLELDASLADRLLGGAGESRHLKAAIDSLHAPRSRALTSRAALAVDADYNPARDTCNVVAVLPGSDPAYRDEALVIGGHLDHVGRQSPGLYFPGANDNASGAAAVLRLAEAFTSTGRAPRRSVVFVLFTGEESGLVGASFHAAHPAFPPERTTAMFNLDCVACGDSIQVGNGKSAPRLWELARSLDAAAARLTVERTWSGGGADATPFHDAGIPCLYWAAANGYGHLHAPDDLPESLNAPLYEELVRLAFRTAWTVADSPDRFE